MSSFLASIWEVLSQVHEKMKAFIYLGGLFLVAYSWLKGYLQRLWFGPSRRIRLILFPMKFDLNESEKALLGIRNGISKYNADIALLTEVATERILSNLNRALSARFRPWTSISANPKRTVQGESASNHWTAMLYRSYRLVPQQFDMAEAFLSEFGGAKHQGRVLFPRQPIIRMFHIRSVFAQYRFLIVFIHLRANRDHLSVGPAIREGRAKAIGVLSDFVCDVRNEYPTLPIVVAGIFWESRDSEYLERFSLETNMTLVSQYSPENEYTIRIDKYDFRDYTDHILVTPDLICKENEYKNPVLALDEVVSQFRNVITDHRPQLWMLPIRTERGIRRERETEMYR